MQLNSIFESIKRTNTCIKRFFYFIICYVTLLYKFKAFVYMAALLIFLAWPLSTL
jgi:hypothetical protein